MPVDPQIQALLDKGTGVPATHTLTVAAARAQYEARISLMAPPAAHGGTPSFYPRVGASCAQARLQLKNLTPRTSHHRTQN